MCAALGKGAPVIATGHVYTSEYEDRDGNKRSSLEMRATAVGPDLSRVFVRIEKPSYTGPTVAESQAPTPAAEASEDSSAQSDDSKALPLSA